MGRPRKQTPDVAALLKELREELAGQFQGLTERINALEERNRAPQVVSSVAVQSSAPLEVARIPAEEQVYPVPAEYREIVDTILNRAFGVLVTPHSDRPSFTFTLVVPDKYSSMSPNVRAMMHYDIRPRVISFAEGINGVRDWCDRVFNNFSPEVRAQIANDRAQLIGV